MRELQTLRERIKNTRREIGNSDRSANLSTQHMRKESKTTNSESDRMALKYMLSSDEEQDRWENQHKDNQNDLAYFRHTWQKNSTNNISQTSSEDSQDSDSVKNEVILDDQDFPDLTKSPAKNPSSEGSSEVSRVSSDSNLVSRATPSFSQRFPADLASSEQGLARRKELEEKYGLGQNHILGQSARVGFTKEDHKFASSRLPYSEPFDNRYDRLEEALLTARESLAKVKKARFTDREIKYTEVATPDLTEREQKEEMEERHQFEEDEPDILEEEESIQQDSESRSPTERAELDIIQEADVFSSIRTHHHQFELALTKNVPSTNPNLPDLDTLVKKSDNSSPSALIPQNNFKEAQKALLLADRSHNLSQTSNLYAAVHPGHPPNIKTNPEIVRTAPRGVLSFKDRCTREYGERLQNRERLFERFGAVQRARAALAKS